MVASKRSGFFVTNEKTDQVQAKFTAHSLRRLFYSTLQGIDDVDKEALHGHVKGVRSRYHASVDEIRKVVEFMRQKYEFAMRSVIQAASTDEQRKRAMLDFAKLQGLSEKQMQKIQETFSMAATADELRELISGMLRRERESEFRHTLPDGGKSFKAKLVPEEDVVGYLERGWEVVRELQNGQVLVRKPP